MKRPYRKNKADRLMNPGASSEEIRCDFILGPLDNMARKMDRKWGIDRLPELVSVETAARYGRAMAAVIQAQRDCDEDKLRTLTQNAQRGLLAMDKEATEAGAGQAQPKVVEFDCDGFRFGIMPEDRNWQVEQDARPDLTIYTMREIGILLRAVSENNRVMEEVKKTGGAEVVRISERKTYPPITEDRIPF